MRILICGLGSIGRRHLHNLATLGQEDIVLYRTGLGTLPDDELVGYPVEHDLATALEGQRPQAVFVTNPTASHLEVAVAAAESGAHLFLEKPVSHSMEGLAALKQAVVDQGVRVQVGYQYRAHPTLIHARQLLLEGAIGQPLSAAAHWGEHLPDWHPWEDYRQAYSARADLGGGVILTLSHPLDYLRWMFGDVEGVQADIGRPGALELDVESQAAIILRHKDGMISTVELNYHQQPPRHDLEVVGADGTLRWDGLTGELRWWSAAQGDWQVERPPQGFERNDMFVAEIQGFLNLAVASTEPICSLEDGIAAVRIACTALEAARTGQRLPLLDGVGVSR
ncbi:MAG: Gfo/Idh/MocA family oxidoreductase [Anaerolineales bacterium]